MKKENRGGVRIPSKGKKLGAPIKLKNGKRTNIYLDQVTRERLLQIHPELSKAIRILAGTDSAE